jgi:uroporphyrin-III C-methyltransferase
LREAGVAFEVVPGVTAALAASADIGVSLTQRGLARSVTFVTPRVGVGERPNEWAHAVSAADTAVIYMGVGQAGLIAGALREQGMPADTPIVVVENASLDHRREMALTLAELPLIAESGIEGPAAILIGRVYAECLVRAVAPAEAVEQLDRRVQNT